MEITYKLNLKYIKNKESMAIAVLECIADYIKRQNRYTTLYFDGNNKDLNTFINELFKHLKIIMLMASNPLNAIKFEIEEHISGFSKCFSMFDREINELMNLIEDQLCILLIGDLDFTSDIMDYVPNFPENKVIFKTRKTLMP